ncbi:ATP-binding cassette domain-containing protein [Actinocorallia sp. API 0066]|uniref:ABC transporter ATP-binding protein n=1 Tax=Actinocorallia sp. API 0066 TaxID=2896846 RepID=UPI001E4D2074|nr:ATP-binding cassette domain-containing protein [Actinocorallia sp. API 0066]MCD0449424.1 ATP-binding cassette domain-containing protein [Actinocorallia sp. API 0066]
MIEVRELGKRYGPVTAVEDLSFKVRPGSVTGFLGPNGAGKSTTIKMIVGLDRPTTGEALVGGRPYRSLREPLRTLGALLDARAVHGGRSAYHHLLWLAQSNGIAKRRVEEVLEQVGLTEVARRRAGGFSLGMGQRMGIAAALLGDPEVLVLDEPVNGLDTEGIRWIRSLMKDLATEGRTIFVASHVMAEMQQTADRLIVIGQGRLIADCTMADFIEENSRTVTLVRSPALSRLAELVTRAGARFLPADETSARVEGMAAPTIGALAALHRIELHELTPQYSSLEEVYTELTKEELDYRTTTAEAPIEEVLR